MYVRYIYNRPYMIEAEWVGGKSVKRHMGPATPGMIALVRHLAAKRAERRLEEQRRREEESRHEKEMSARFEATREAFEEHMRQAGYHNTLSRGWRKRRAARPG